MAGSSASERIGLFFRFTRVQFLPVVFAPLAVGAAASWYVSHSVNPVLLLLLFLGSATLLIASNSIDDVYDYLNGVDQASERIFPKEFPGWKPIPRGLMSVTEGFTISFAFYFASISIGVYLAFAVGWLALAIAIPGIFLSYFYVAPPLKLDYRGLGLGELSIFLGFGPIPALGAFYVLTHGLGALPILVSVPCGMLTVDVLLTHDMIFYESYKEAGKRSLTVVLGLVRAEWLTVALAATAYVFSLSLVVLRAIPVGCALVVLALPLLIRRGLPTGEARSPAEYGLKTQDLFLHSVAFSVLLAAGLLI
jgi:1,4-dihydroxy-2-naphthoate octaprenyltransferase